MLVDEDEDEAKKFFQCRSRDPIPRCILPNQSGVARQALFASGTVLLHVFTLLVAS